MAEPSEQQEGGAQKTMQEKLVTFSSLDEVLKYCERYSEYMDCDIDGPNARSIMSNTPLHTYSYDGNLSALELLLDNGATINAIGDIGYTPLHCAALGNNGKAIKLLLGRGADRTIQDEFADTALDVALQGDKHDAITELQKNRVTVLDSRNE